jgi:secreted trypsin-like serine protease
MNRRRRRLGGAALALGAIVLLAAPSSGIAAPSSLRIVGGGKASAAGWQFAVALTQKRRFICSGSLIAPTKVLTAAHCVKGGKRKQLSVLAGSPWITPHKRRPRIKVAAVAIDPAFNGRKDSHDFSVLTLASAPEAQPIALATPAESKAATRPGRIVRSGGWGARSAWGFNVARRLKTTKERVYPARKCDREYGKSRGFQQASMICALGKRVGRAHSRLPFRSTSCEGDSGGPLVADTPNGPRLIGAVSSGIFPCGLGGASIYARVANRLGFIKRAAELP